MVNPHIEAETGGRDVFFDAKGNEVAALGSGRLAMARFSTAFTPVSESYPASTPGVYVVNAGDTLESIALAVYGDDSLWFLIADANSLSAGPTDSLTSQAGGSYRIPNV